MKTFIKNNQSTIIWMVVWVIGVTLIRLISHETPILIGIRDLLLMLFVGTMAIISVYNNNTVTKKPKKEKPTRFKIIGEIVHDNAGGFESNANIKISFMPDTKRSETQKEILHIINESFNKSNQ